MREIPVIADCCDSPVLGEPLDQEEAERLASALRVLADPGRLRLLSLIAARGDACVCHLTEPMGLSQPTVSHHLKVLHEAGLLEREQRGRWVHYRVIRSSLGPMAEALAPTGRVPAGFGG